MSALRLLIADDHGLVRAGIRSLLEGLGHEVVGEAGDGTEALRLIATLLPDVALMDISMPGMNGLEATRRAAKHSRKTRFLMLSMHTDAEYVRHALVAGAAGYLLKSAERAELEMALASVARGEIWLSSLISRPVLVELLRVQGPADVAARTERLTTRQREILQLVAEGRSTKEIAERLQISAKTVESHRAHIMERLGAHNVATLVRYAIRTGLLLPEA